MKVKGWKRLEGVQKGIGGPLEVESWGWRGKDGGGALMVMI